MSTKIIASAVLTVACLTTVASLAQQTSGRRTPRGAAQTDTPTETQTTPAAQPNTAEPVRFEVRNDGGSRIQFVSDAPLETITGVSSHVTGEVTVTPDRLAATRGTIRVPISSIRTGIDLRDEHLRGESWLNATQFPEARFEIVRFEGPSSLRAGGRVEGTLVGRFFLHGISREVRARVQVRWMNASPELQEAHVTGDVLRVQASFNISLADFGVSILAPVRLKVANELEVNVTLRAVSASDAPGATH